MADRKRHRLSRISNLKQRKPSVKRTPFSSAGALVRQVKLHIITEWPVPRLLEALFKNNITAPVVAAQGERFALYAESNHIGKSFQLLCPQES